MRLRELRPFSLGKKRLRMGIFAMCIKWEEKKIMEPDSSQWCLLTGQEAMGTN